MMRFLKKYDWVKISGILVVLIIDVLIVIGIITLCSCRGASKMTEYTEGRISEEIENSVASCRLHKNKSN